MQINMKEQLSGKEQINNFYDFNNIYSKGLEDIILNCELRRDIGLVHSFEVREIRKKAKEIVKLYNQIKKLIEKHVLNYKYKKVIIHKLDFLLKYCEIKEFEVIDNVILLSGFVTSDRDDAIYYLNISIDDEKIKITSVCELEYESLINSIEVTYKTIPQDDMKEYISVTTSHKNKYLDIDSWYIDENIVNKLLCLKETDGKIITALKRKNTKETTTLLCGNYQGFNGDRVIKEHNNSVTLWNGIGVNIGYVIGSYVNSKMEYGKKINGEEYYYASRNNSPTLCDITADVVKVPLNFEDFNVALEGKTLEKSIPISSKIIEAENEYTFGTLQKIAQTKPFV